MRNPGTFAGAGAKTSSLSRILSTPRAELHAKTALASSAPSSDPPRLEIRINVSDRRRPIGRSRLFRIEEHQLAELIGAVEKLEARHV
jgi:hypothetical protein